eukprot:536192_1
MSSRKLTTMKWYVAAIILLSIMYNCTFMVFFIHYEDVKEQVLTDPSGSIDTDSIESTLHISNSTSEEYQIIQRIKFENENNFHLISITSTPSNSHSLDQFLQNIRHDNTTCKQSIYILHAHQCCAVQHTINHLYSLGFTHLDYQHIQNVSSDYKKMINSGTNIIGCLGLIIHENDKNLFKFLHPLADKTELYHTIMAYCNKYNITKSCMSWMPVTYDLRITEQRLRFFEQLPCTTESSREWLLKTSMHVGKGVHLIHNPNVIRKFYLDPLEQQQTNCVVNIEDSDENYQNISQTLVKQAVGQKLVSNALKYKGCSFHIRSEFILASYGTPRLVLYVRSYAVRSLDSSEFRSNAHWSLRFLNENEDHLPLEMDTLAEYFGERFNVTDIERQMINAAKSIFNSVLDGLNAPWKQWQHYAKPGLDFLVTDEFEVKFLDFNPHHGTPMINCYVRKKTELGTKVVFQRNYIQCVEDRKTMEEMVNIEIEIATKKAKRMKIDTLKSLNNFQTVIWEYDDLDTYNSLLDEPID